MATRTWFCASVLLVAVGASGLALAQNAGVIEQRRKLFKHLDVAADDLYDMSKGKRPFDLAFAQKNLRVIADDAKQLPPLWPDDSKVGNTRSLPRVWTDKARFDDLLAQFGKVSEAAAGTVTDQKTFVAAMPKLLGECKSCHDDFRAKKK